MSAVSLSVVAVLVLAQVADGGSTGAAPAVTPVPADTDNTASDVVRSSGLEGNAAAAAASDAGTSGIAENNSGALTPPPGTPIPGAGTPSMADDIEGKIAAALRLSETLVSWLPVDDQGNYVGPRPFQTRLRVAPEVHFKGFGALAEFDAASGAVIGNPPQAGLLADRVPVPNFQPIELRQLFLEYRWKSGVFRIGQQTNHFNLGILANAGNADPQAGDFGQQHFGSFVYRALLAGRPLFSLGGAWRALELYGAGDLVWKDSNADFSIGDRAFQGILGVRFKADDDRYAGVTLIYRRQRAIGVTDGGRETDAFVVDLGAKWVFFKREDRALNLGAEVVGIFGTTTQTRTDVAPVSQVRQFGAAAKASYRFRAVTVLFDWGYASGDQNPYDDRIEGYRFDRDYKVGLVLFDQVLGYQSARAGFRAADPNLTGVPPEGVHLLPTGGGVYNAWYLFPRLKYGFTDWLDLYGGPLFAFSTAKLTDAFSTKVRGGTPHNYLGAQPGDYLGTELDLGIQARWKPHRLLQITGTIEGGILLPGDAFRQADGTTMGPIGLGRARLVVAL